MIKRNSHVFLLVLLVLIYFVPVFIKLQLPIPSDTIVGLYHPFRDAYSKTYPNGIPFKNFLITDPVRQQYPWRNLAIEEEMKLQLPLWNPYNFSGAPLFANFQTAAFNPFNILFFFMPFPFAWSVLILLQPLFAAVFMYLYVRHLKISKSSAMLSGFIFAFCGFSTAWLEWGTILQTLLWLPLILYATDKYFFQKNFNLRSKDSLKWGGLFLFALILSFTGGHIQTFIYVFAVFILYFSARCIQYRSLKYLIPLIYILLFFMVITFFYWYPVLQFILLSARDLYQLDSWKVSGWFIPWGNLLQFIAPDFFGNPSTLNYWGVWNYAEFVGYIGLLPLLLAFHAIYNRQDKKTFFFGLIFFTSLIFALPTFLAILPYQFHLPFFSTTQPTRLLAITDFSLAILVGLGLDNFLYQKKSRKIFYPLIFLGFVFLIIWVFLVMGHNSLKLFPEDKIFVIKHNLYFPTAIYGISFILLISYLIFQKKNNAIIKPIFIFLIIGISVFDLLRFSMKFNTFANQQYLFPQTKILTYLQNQKGQFRVMTNDDQILPPNFSIMYKLQSLDGYDPLYLKNYVELIAAIDRKAPNITPPYGYKRIIAPHDFNSRLINLMGVKYVLSFNEITDKQFEKKISEGKTIVYENKNVFPRAFFVKNIMNAKSNQEAITTMFDSKIDLKNTAVVQNWDQTILGYTHGDAAITQYEENNLVIQTHNNADGYLVLMDAYYPTWHAEVCDVNGSECHPTKIYKTNYNYRGILVAKGVHLVKFHIALL